MDNQKYTRNFAIVAHIDHGKSTLADRLLEATGTIEPRLMKEQVLDSNPIERERGITIKLAPVRMKYMSNGEEYILNLIDTPGHVDFSYEVSRSLAACEGIILVVDATQGIQAQTVAHMALIKDKNLKVIPVINKIDLPTAKIEETKSALSQLFGFDKEEMIEISAKSGTNIDKVLGAVIERIPAPGGSETDPVKALVFSSVYDIHKGVVIFVKIVDGIVEQAQFRFMASKAVFHPVDIGVFTPEMKTTGKLSTGEVGYISTGLKDLSLARVGDTVSAVNQNTEPLPGYKEPKPMVYLSLYPTDSNDFLILRESLEKLHLSDSSFTYKLHSSLALGKGYLCGFLGLLHADIIRERLEKEFLLNVIATAPTVEYGIVVVTGEIKNVHTPDDFPDPSQIKEIKEPLMYTTIYSPSEYVGNVMQLCETKRAEYVNLEYIGSQAKFTYLIPLSEMIVDFFDGLKSQTSGYASLDYEFYEMRKVDAVKVDILINHKKVDAFAQIVVREKVQNVAEKMVSRLKELIPRHQFQIPIQAAIGGKVVARSDVKSFRKDVTQKLYGGDRTRKDKLLEAQKKGKKKMRSVGNVDLPQEIFFDLYKNT
ncbi:MAG: translation elongation factor 4 [Patescibacteria group bacterium]|nr:translation elongation factor 4 [Patescibacteria group bacterium]